MRLGGHDRKIVAPQEEVLTCLSCRVRLRKRRRLRHRSPPAAPFFAAGLGGLFLRGHVHALVPAV